LFFSGLPAPRLCLCLGLLLCLRIPAQPQSVATVSQQSTDRPQENEVPKSGNNGPAPYSMRVSVPLVSLDVSVLTENGFFVPDLKKENFRVFEDGIPQTLTGFNERHAPVTAVLLVEFTADMSPLQINALRASYRFGKSLKEGDWTALVLFDKHTHIALDFTQDKGALQQSLNGVALPLSREITLYDSLIETIDRLQQVEGRKYIILMASGLDTLSKHVYDDVLKRIESAKDTVIYTIDTARGLRHLQAENQMGVFARMTGGRAFFPRSDYDYGDAFHYIGQTIRNHDILAYRPSHEVQDGVWHSIKVNVVNPAQSDPGSKEDLGRKYQVIARAGYRGSQR
jgi:VWFA-related protein